MPTRKITIRGLAALFALSGLAVASYAWADTPMSYMRTYGPAGYPVTQLNWGVTAISVLVSVIIGLLVLWAVFRRRPPAQLDQQGRLPLAREPGGLKWIYIGVGITMLVLIGVTTWNAVTLAAVSQPQQEPAFTVVITAHQWWWEARYPNEDPTQSFVTANEIHIPVGKPVVFKLQSADVIHSFWIPRLGGKTDLIPGQTTMTWLQADQAGVYRGQCGEYCGAQHAHMVMHVVAEEQARFDTWRAAQLAGAAQPRNVAALQGREVFNMNCSVCHTVRDSMHSTMAQGKLGPDLTHLMSRDMIAAGLLKNSRGSLHGWIANPQELKPGSRMPRIPMSPQKLHELVAYLEALK